MRVTFESAVKLEQLEKLSEQFSALFPSKKTQIAHEHTVKVTDAAATAESHAKSEILGHVRFTENRDKAVQLRVNGFAFSKLKPYESWPALRDEAREHWETYRGELGPSRIARLAVRYINRIELSLPITDFQDYVLTGPQIADGIPQGLAEFFSELWSPIPTTSRCGRSSHRRWRSSNRITKYFPISSTLMPSCRSILTQPTKKSGQPLKGFETTRTSSSFILQLRKQRKCSDESIPCDC